MHIDSGSLQYLIFTNGQIIQTDTKYGINRTNRCDDSMELNS